MRSLRPALLTCLCLTFVSPAFAQDVRTLAEEYVRMPEVQQMMTDMFSPASMAAQIASSLPPGMPLTEEQSDRIGTLLSGAMNGFRPRMESLMIEASTRHFSAAELQALIDFYRSEHGASVMAKMQPYMQDVMGALTPDVMAEMGRLGPEIETILGTP
jgi:hypothetical protein